MPEDRKEERVDVLRDDELALVQQRAASGSALEREAPPDGRAGRDALDLSRGPHEIDDPVEEQVVDVDVLDRSLDRAHVVRGDDRRERGERMPVPLLLDDPNLLGTLWVAERRSVS